MGEEQDRRGGEPRPLGRLGSLRLSIAVIIALAVLSAVGTFLPPEKLRGWFLSAARMLGLAETPKSPPFLLLLCLLAVNILICTWQRFSRNWKSGLFSRGFLGAAPACLDLILHLSIIVILAGGLVKGLCGFQGTRYLFVGQTMETVHDVKRDAEVPLGFGLLLKKKRELYYPLRVRVKVTAAETGEVLGVLEAAEGRPARVPGSDLVLGIGGFDGETRDLWLETSLGGEEGRVDLQLIPGGRTVADTGPYRVSLVEYRRDLKRVESRVAVVEGGREAKEALLSPNSWLTYRGTRVYQTAWGTDRYGFEYIGVQISRDPGSKIFWAGSLLLSLSLPLFILFRHRSRVAGNGPDEYQVEKISPTPVGD